MRLILITIFNIHTPDLDWKATDTFYQTVDYLDFDQEILIISDEGRLKSYKNSSVNLLKNLKWSSSSLKPLT